MPATISTITTHYTRLVPNPAHLSDHCCLIIVMECDSVVFASGRGGAKISRPAPHRTRGRGMKFRPRPAPPRNVQGPGRGAGRGTASEAPPVFAVPRIFLRGPGTGNWRGEAKNGPPKTAKTGNGAGRGGAVRGFFAGPRVPRSEH